MIDPIMQAYLDVERAMEQYNSVLKEHVDRLKSLQTPDTTRIERMSQGARAMRDSSAIYLSYAKFIAYGMPDSEELVRDELQT